MHFIFLNIHVSRITNGLTVDVQEHETQPIAHSIRLYIFICGLWLPGLFNFIFTNSLLGLVQLFSDWAQRCFLLDCWAFTTPMNEQSSRRQPTTKLIYFNIMVPLHVTPAVCLKQKCKYMFKITQPSLHCRNIQIHSTEKHVGNKKKTTVNKRHMVNLFYPCLFFLICFTTPMGNRRWTNSCQAICRLARDWNGFAAKVFYGMR